MRWLERNPATLAQTKLPDVLLCLTHEKQNRKKSLPYEDGKMLRFR